MPNSEITPNVSTLVTFIRLTSVFPIELDLELTKNFPAVFFFSRNQASPASYRIDCFTLLSKVRIKAVT
jgi:hypothetical protein